ncbi:unnamed protein product [Mytilus edulis]|uniref:Uncharacterized protein n=1 Tax=Mytilus edulis TaxID=6550 RepID=A0A8S3V6G9_MYTED|nr:unnamed protein product [Mytilus edulis]
MLWFRTQINKLFILLDLTSHCSHPYDVGIHCYHSCPAEEDEGKIEFKENVGNNPLKSTCVLKGIWYNLDVTRSGKKIASYDVDYGNGNIWLVNMHCSGLENKLINCTYSVDISYCQHQYDVGVHCYLSCPAEEDEGHLRLVPGSASNKKDDWKLITEVNGEQYVLIAGVMMMQQLPVNSLDIADPLLKKMEGVSYSTKSCIKPTNLPVSTDSSIGQKTADFNSGQSIPSNYVDDGNGTIWLVNVHCSGSENKLINCTHSIETSHCPHQYDVGVHCYLSCPAEEDEGHLRLITGSASNKGRLEINYRGEWGTICAHSWGHDDAAVACKQLGYCSGQSIPHDYIDDGNGTIWLVRIDCTGSENKLINCTHLNDASFCPHEYDVGVHCYLSCPAEEDEGHLRLITGSDINKGRLEINYKGEWGTICAHSWGHVDAVVACKQLGYCSGQSISHDYTDDGNGTIWLVRIDCTGSENKLINCTHLNDASFCPHEYDVGVHCYLSCPAEEDNGRLRLITSSAENKGRLEINYNGEWGTICNWGFHHVNAAVACRQLGSGETISSNLVDDGQGTIWLVNVDCSGSENKLINCTYSISTSHCRHWHDVGIDCFNCATETTTDASIFETTHTTTSEATIAASTLETSNMTTIIDTTTQLVTSTMSTITYSSSQTTTTSQITSAAARASELMAFGEPTGDSRLYGDDVTTNNLGCFTSIPFLGDSFNYLTKTVTFQFILATNGAKTYAYSLFKDVNILSPPGGRQCAIGYSGLGGTSSSIYSFTESAFGVSELRGNTFDARTDLATSKNGTELKKINATIFSGFAAKEDGNATMQVELASDLETMVVYGNGNDYTSLFNTNENFAVFLTGIVLRRQNHTLVVAFSQSGIQLNFQIKTRQLTLSASVPEDFKGQVTGLMGNFDGDKSNEFLLPNRNILSSGDVNSERKIHNNFGLLWETTSDNSIFDYTDGKSWADYSHQDFVPIFIDEFDNSTLQLAYTVCGGKSDQYKACIFDYLATGDQSFADDTQITNAEAESETTQLQNEAPEISGQESIKVIVNQSIVLNFTGHDDKADFRYSIIDQPGEGTFTSDNSTGNLTLTWTPANLNTEKIRVTTVDSDGLTADAIEVVIIACSGCSGDQGTCDYDNLRNESNPNYLIASCNCTTGWSGDDCDINTNGCADNPSALGHTSIDLFLFSGDHCDINTDGDDCDINTDRCADDPCALGRTCIDLSPPDEELAGRGYNCSNCPAGYTITDDEKCEDINECLDGMDNCPANSNCTNTDGSFTCICLEGFRKVGSECQDIDECTERTSGCEQICANSDGSFTCSCVYGFEILADGKCNQTIFDVCALQNLTCSYGCDNTTNPGTWECICPEGYLLHISSGNCSNINECDANVCTQTCQDTVGSYTCSCYTGFKLNDDKTSCSACVSPFYGENCASQCSCGPGALRCDPSRGCVCNSAWTGTNCDVDVDECEDTPGICQSDDKTCVNEDGGYECNCRAGYEKVSADDSVPCADINECSSATTNNCSSTISTCQNTDGGYTCRCNTGYQTINTYECEDVDECTSESDDCEQDCVNNVGSYNCRCFLVSDPCGTLSNLTCSYACRLKTAPQFCYCQSGYVLQADNQTCTDSAADVNTICKRYIRKEQVKPSTITLRMWNKTPMKPIGEVHLKLINPKNGDETMATLVVVPNGHMNLLGLETIRRMGLITVNDDRFIAKVETQKIGDLGEITLKVDENVPEWSGSRTAARRETC